MGEGSPTRRLDRAVEPHLERLLTPALIIDLDAVEHNVRAMVARVGDAGRWRPHVKTVKQSAVIELLLEAGVRQVKCATLDELALVLDCGQRAGVDVDVLLAYPASRPVCQGALELRAAHPRATVALLLDNPTHARDTDGLVASSGAATPVDVFLDVNIGMDRTGSAPAVWRDACTGVLDSLSALRVRGLHGYDGHRGWDERAAAHAGYDALCDLAAALPRADDLAFVVTSGTHSYAHALAYEGFTGRAWTHQVSPGTIILSDLRSHAAAADLGLRQAAFVATRVVSAPTPGRITLDAGSKGLSPDMAPPACEVLGWPELAPQRASEEHRPVRVEGGSSPAVGDLVWLVPEHVCTTVNLYREALWLRGDQIVGHGPVEAASHPLWLAEQRV